MQNAPDQRLLRHVIRDPDVGDRAALPVQLQDGDGRERLVLAANAPRGALDLRATFHAGPPVGHADGEADRAQLGREPGDRLFKMLPTGPAPDPRTACTLLQNRAADRGLRVVSGYAVNDGADRPRRFEAGYRDGRYHRLGRGFSGSGGAWSSRWIESRSRSTPDGVIHRAPAPDFSSFRVPRAHLADERRAPSQALTSA